MARERWVVRPNKPGWREEQGKCELKGSRHGVRGKRTERGGNTKREQILLWFWQKKKQQGKKERTKRAMNRPAEGRRVRLTDGRRVFVGGAERTRYHGKTARIVKANRMRHVARLEERPDTRPPQLARYVKKM
jgi:hypothetical protein